MTRSLTTYDDAVAFHGHSCPGLALGYRAADYAMKRLNAERSEDEDLVAIVENDACGVDAVQALAGCSVGKGNLIMRDIGKHAYTFINRKTGTAIRLVQRPEPLTERIDPEVAALRRKVTSGKATPAEIKKFHERQAGVIEKILTIPFGELFIEKEARSEIPERARISGSVQCAVCGEMVAEHRARVKNGKIVCIPCAGEYSRGW
ncbi:MAG: FmdE family protein [Methanoregula sp.]|jgi:formylmethanofuran dehydrogenase subunit E|uniref:FmdE family protein n=1 Tax=Methanoregula sp. TaxID=2052170 RepID=UPI003D09E26E